VHSKPCSNHKNSAVQHCHCVCCPDSRIAHEIYQCYHDFVELARSRVETYRIPGLFLDLHGLGPKYKLSQIGYVINSNHFQNLSMLMDSDCCSVANAARELSNNASNENVVYGAQSFGALLTAHGITCTPSPRYPFPRRAPCPDADLTYMAGQYSVKRYGARFGDTIDGIQLELIADLRNKSNMQHCATHISSAVHQWLSCRRRNGKG
jgi:hypothetical protein